MRAPKSISEFPHYPVTAGTAALAVGVTVAWWTKVDISPLLPSATIRRGELWRLVTSILPHGGILHLAFNVYWLWIFGSIIEEVFGHLKTLALFAMFAVGSSALEFGILDGGMGLSGVGYGLFGLLWILSDRDPRFENAVDQRTVQLFVAWFFICIVTTLFKVMPVANLAHAGGAVLGILVGSAISMPRRRGLAVGGAVLFLAFALWAATVGRPRVNLSRERGREEAQFAYKALESHRNQEAVRWLRDAIRYRPHESAYWFNLMIAYSRLGDQPGFLTACRRAAEEGEAEAQNTLGEFYNFGSGGLAKNETQAAYWYLKAADQGNVDAENSIAWLYLTSADPALRNPSMALQYARKAVKAGNENPNPNYLDTLAEAYYANRQYGDAVKTEQEVIRLAALQKELARYMKDFEERLAKYQRGGVAQSPGDK